MRALGLYGFAQFFNIKLINVNFRHMLSVVQVSFQWTSIIQVAVRVTTLRVLGVEISSDLGMSAQIEQVLASCASSMYALRVLRCRGLPPPQLHEVARATTIASLMYASPSWWGFSSAKDRSRMERLINKLKRSGFLPESAPSAVALAGEDD